MEVNAILLLIFLVLGIIAMIMEIVQIVQNWKKEKELVRRVEDLSLRMEKVTIDDLRKGCGLPPIKLYEFNDPKDFESAGRRGGSR